MMKTATLFFALLVTSAQAFVPATPAARQHPSLAASSRNLDDDDFDGMNVFFGEIYKGICIIPP
jgi:hypothetical protein